LENISADPLAPDLLAPEQLAQDLLECCLATRPWPEQLLDRLLAANADHALFRIVVERLGDLFEPRLCGIYAELFSNVIARRIPLHAEHLLARYQRVRNPRACDREPATVENVFVLSRVTLGADVAITSVMLDAAKQRFPNARIWFVGPHKGWELFAGDTRLSHLPIAYGRRGTLDDRLSIWPALREAVSKTASVVIDPDSRLTQLGLLPICQEPDYYFFESRSFGGDGTEPLSALAGRWAAETFGVTNARPYIRTGLDAAAFATTVSFGVGENPAKRLEGDFETELLRKLPRPILIDKGAGGEEAQRVERAVAGAGDGIVTWEGSFAGFAEHIARSRLYVGYDSAGGHVAAACGVPLVSIFAGFASERMLQRWRPAGPGRVAVIRADQSSRPLDDALRASSEFYRAAEPL
jgi:Glycosyltransferase family 9 (heptosyltransferase)